MKIYTSYFYGIRFFKPNMIPISTAKWDPKWFHQNNGQDYVWVDKNNVINGLRAEVFAPGPVASSLCHGGCDPKDPNNCAFLRAYDYQLSQLNYNDIIKRTEDLCERVRTATQFEGEPIAVFIVHEAPDNPCSERAAIQKFFNCEELDLNKLK